MQRQPVVELTGLCGERVGVDADLIEAVQAVPCTLVSLVDGSCLEVSEGVTEVVEMVTRYRASLLVGAAELADDAPLAEIRALPARPA